MRAANRSTERQATSISAEDNQATESAPENGLRASADEGPSLEELAARITDASRAAFEHAARSLEQAHSNAAQNWSKVGTLVSAEESAPCRAVSARLERLHLRLPGQGSGERGDVGASGLGSLWDAAGSAPFGPLQMQTLKRKLHQHIKDVSSLREAGRHVAIVTTASLPWMTGTAVNPLLRAHFLSAQQADRQVTLVIPWLSMPDQRVVYPSKITFETPDEQERYVRNWVEQRTGGPSTGFRVVFYPGRYAPEKGSILPVGDITQYIPDHEADVAVLEEPEHLNWYHHGRRWTDKFNHVVGVMHTNYLDYARREESGRLKEFFLRYINGLVCRVHCHKVIKLSDAVQRLPRECTHFVHGVSPRFLEVGAAMATAMRERACALERAAQLATMPERDSLQQFPRRDVPEVWTRGAYFLGKVVWAKGYTELLELLEAHKQRHGEALPMDVYGAGDDLPAVQERAETASLPLTFHGPMDHADEMLRGFKVFVNPSLSDVVATTTAEALAMGKFVVCAQHPCNAFFSTFSNCLIYRTPEEFSEKLVYALSHDPKPMSPDEIGRLTWEDATERFLDAVKMAPRERPNPLERVLDNIAYAAHNSLTGVEALRINAGAGAGTLHTPQRVTDFVATTDNVGGLFDNQSRAKRIYKK